MITLLLIIPIIGSLILIPIKENKFNNNNLMKNIALITSLLNLFYIYNNVD
jgi:NADH-ubiquinone oxidoreductase chain 4